MAASAAHKDLPVKLAVQIEPLGDRVVVVPVEKEQTTKSGIIIPETASGEKPSEGIVIALGTGGMMDDGKEMANPHDYLKIGDHVLYGRYAGDDVKLKNIEGKDVEVKILHIGSVLCKVKA